MLCVCLGTLGNLRVHAMQVMQLCTHRVSVPLHVAVLPNMSRTQRSCKATGRISSLAMGRSGVDGPAVTRSEQQVKSHSREVLNNDKCRKRAPNKSQLHRGKTRRVNGPAGQTSGLAERAQTEESQPVVLYADPSYIFTDELFDKYPPPEHMGIDAAAFSELRAELLGQQLGGRLPNQGQRKRFQCTEQFLLYDSALRQKHYLHLCALVTFNIRVSLSLAWKLLNVAIVALWFFAKLIMTLCRQLAISGPASSTSLHIRGKLLDIACLCCSEALYWHIPQFACLPDPRTIRLCC